MPIFRRAHGILVFLSFLLLPLAASAQPLLKSVINVDPGPSKQTGQTFTYRLTYNCSNTSGPCLGASVVDLLPLEVQFVSTVPAGPGGDVASVTVTPNFMASGRTRVLFTMVSPLTAGNSGDLLINVRFPAGTTPNGTVATNTADGINLQTVPGTFTTPPVTVTAVATPQIDVTKSLSSTPANLDMPETYNLSISVPNSPGALSLTAIGPIVDTLPVGGVVFNGATPAADCEPGCVGTTPATLTWTAPCSVPLSPGNSCNITVNVTFPSASFPSGTNVTNSFTGTATPLGQPTQSTGIGSLTHPVTTFVPNPSATLSKGFAGQPQPPALDMDFAWSFSVANSGNVALDNYVVIDTVPVDVNVLSVTTGSYSTPPTTVTVDYEKNTALGVFTLWGSSPGNVNATLTAPPPGLGVGEYITRIRWTYGTVQPGFSGSARLNVHLLTTDQLGSPVNTGDNVQNCVDLTSVYTPGPTAVNRNACHNFTVSGPFVRSSPSKINLSGAGPFNPGQTIAWELRANNENFGTGSFPLPNLVLTDLLPIDLLYTAGSQTCLDSTCTGFPPAFAEIPNYDNTGRTLLRWTFVGNLLPGEDVRIGYATTVRNGAFTGNLTNRANQSFPAGPTAQRCANGIIDINDLDGDGSRADTLCTVTANAAIAPIAQVVSSKQARGLCDADFVSAPISASTLPGGEILYRLRVQNVGTVSMEDFVIIDILPFIGDTGVRDTNPRSSLWRPLLVGPITPPPGTTIYYSTSGNPCRGEVGGPTSSCDPPNWSTVPPVPITNVLSFKIEFGNRVVAPFDFLEFVFPMIAPANAPLGGADAFNSFAYLGERSDGIGSLAAEPQKIGVEIGNCAVPAELGDFVWVDTNADGIQNDGPTGLNNVYVELYQPGVDGLPRTLDDVLVASTITSDDLGGNAGWYHFPNLDPGNYYVAFYPPAPYMVTTPDQGSDGLDSDADPLTSCAPITNLSPGESDLTIDAGLKLVPQASAGLGNYVWFDRDANGIQDNPTTDGANGITVKLFADNGNGTQEPFAGDGMPVQTTVTADDPYGNPGFYEFRNLIPGVPYFVVFMLPSGVTATTQNAGGDDALDSDAAPATGISQIVTLAADEFNPTIDAGLILPAGDLELGDQVFMDNDNDGLFEPQNGEMGLDGVELSLYLDRNGDFVPTLDEYVGATATFTSNGFPGRYRFTGLAPGNYIVVVDLVNFEGGGPLETKRTSTGNEPTPDPDDDANGDDNGDPSGAFVVSRPVTLVNNNEPTAEDGDNDTNLTVDFGFITSAETAEFDFGDNPDVTVGTTMGDYNTEVLDVGPSHRLDVAAQPYLGLCVDADPGTQQNVGASADDAVPFGLVNGTCAVDGDDEDGVAFTNPVTPGASATFTVSAAAGTDDCTLNAWVDWNGNGSFIDVGEQIATNVVIASGASTNLTPTVPAAAKVGVLYSRFRCSTASDLTPTGPAPDGEVEDHLVTVRGFDLGDAPNTYGTNTVGVGATHTVDPLAAIYLGACVDFEGDGQPNAGANGDDNSQGTSRVGNCFDDEDGVIFGGMAIACQNLPLTVAASAAGRLEAFFDWDRDGNFTAAADNALDNILLTAGANNLIVPVPCTVNLGPSYVRFRFSSAGNTPPAGNAADGEVEDYAVTLKGTDLGDAPAPFPTLVADNGARHGVDSALPLFLGACVDTEIDGQASGGAFGDDTGAGNGTVGTCAVSNDDEDGVIFPQMVACQTVNVAVTANAAGRLDAWIDFEGDGDWTGVGEQIANNLVLAAGVNNVSVTIPCNADPGNQFARFRFSSTGSFGITGAAMDGEIEDHLVLLRSFDLGDAPDSYGTLLASSGPSHELTPGINLFLGSCVDNEGNGQPTAGADGDDVNTTGGLVLGTCAGGNDDENGVTLPTQLIACANTSIPVVATAAGRLHAWIDFDGNGIFDPADSIANNLALTAGVNNVNFVVPCNVVDGLTYARFRVTSETTMGPTLPAIDGEVEDYVILNDIVDFGDAPDSYSTTFPNGPRHEVLTGFRLGANEDNEGTGVPSVDALGDDNAGSPDDEDGIVFVGGPVARVCSTGNQLTVTLINTAAVATARLDAWIDFDGDGLFDQPTEHLFGGVSANLTAGANNLIYDVPCTAIGQPISYARFRLSSAGSLPPSVTPAVDGEVEDYTFEIQGFDFGDAPDPSYPVLLASNGARHIVLPTNNPTLGATVDFEPNGLQSAAHTGDDADGTPDDEDGVTFSADVIPGTDATITLQGGATGGIVSGWIDWNRNGSWNDPGEQIIVDINLGAGQNLPIVVPVPPFATPGPSCGRFRIASTGGLTPVGQANNGEVEDHAVEIDAPDPMIGAAKQVILVETAGGSTYFRVVYEIILENLGNVPLDSIQAPVSLATAYALAEDWMVETVTSSDFSINGAFNGDTDPNLLTGSDTMAVGAIGRIELTIRVDPGGLAGPWLCSTTVTGITPQNEVVEDPSQDGPDPDPDVNDDPTDNNEPTPVIFGVPAIEVPTLGTYGLLLMALLLAGAGLVMRRP